MLLTDFSFTKIDADDRVLYVVNPIKSRGLDKLARLFIKALLTQKGSNLDDPTYGTRIVEIAGSTTDSGGNLVRTKVVRDVRDAINWFRDMQLNNPVDDEEMLKDVKIMDIDYDIQKGNVNVKLYLLNNKGKMAVFGIAV